MRLIAELKRRNVFRMAGLYLVAAWLIVQVAETLLPLFGTPTWVLKALVLLLALGFVPMLVFAWVFELTPEGLKRDGEVATPAALTPQSGQRLNGAIISLLVLALAFFAFERFVLLPQRESAARTEAAPTAAQSRPQSPRSDADPRSIAVLPFANISAAADNDYFSDGMTEELLNVLAGVPQLKVVARTSVFRFKDSAADVRAIGADLGVAHIVEGSVRRDGQNVRITVQLVRVLDGFHVWSRTFDRRLENVFALQDEIARQVTSALSNSLGVVSATPARTPVDPAAFDFYLKGRSLLRQRAELPTAIEHFRQAVNLAPEFAAAWSSLALAHEVLYWYEQLDRVESLEALAKAAAAAARAAALAPDSAASEHVQGNVARARFRYAEAERHYLRAMQLDPSYPDAREDYSELLYVVGRMQDSARASRELVTLDPYFPVGWMRLLVAAIALDAGNEVREADLRLRNIAPGNYMAWFGSLHHALAYGRRDDFEKALVQLEKQRPEEGRTVRGLLPWVFREAEPSLKSVQSAFAKLPPGDPSIYLIARQDVEGYNRHMASVGPMDQTYYFGDMYRSKPMGQAMLRDPRVKARLVEYGFVAYWREKGWPAGCRALGDDDFECGLDTVAVAP